MLSRWIEQYCANASQQTRSVPQTGWSYSWLGGGRRVRGAADNMQPSVLQLLGKDAEEC